MEGLVSILFTIIAAILSAISTNLSDESFLTSIFSELNQKFWYKRESYKYTPELFGYHFDGYHLSKLLAQVAITYSLVCYKPLFALDNRYMIFIHLSVWIVIYTLFKKGVFQKRS
jgi:hypothetical protein